MCYILYPVSVSHKRNRCPQPYCRGWKAQILNLPGLLPYIWLMIYDVYWEEHTHTGLSWSSQSSHRRAGDVAVRDHNKGTKQVIQSNTWQPTVGGRWRHKLQFKEGGGKRENMVHRDRQYVMELLGNEMIVVLSCVKYLIIDARVRTETPSFERWLLLIFLLLLLLLWNLADSICIE